MESSIRKIGNSEGAIIPASLLQKLHLMAGDKVSIEEINGKIVISSTKPKYRLEDLVAKCDESAPMSQELKEWDRSEPVGNEVW
ncbi:AbrB/MazE/SpoVT family DNA-binding domain-containing protein [uncultured Methylophaga sp.]|uniref:AbrB/MazE/SpoVT family DNA-binding domain-containing protein n=1 Tax=uncultured Methylophaga sp. TaxID=285271 RepID=UPI0026018021|nr:AbrB/MazE/SpoVT family DNA-binding domain-containing protein [uncultured Methylophaga sp.]